MKAVVLAGGQGFRLRPYTLVLPKPLMPVLEKPIIQLLVQQLAAASIKELVLSVGYLGSLLEAYLKDGRQWGAEITYSYESSPLGTAGPISLVEGLDSDFVVINGDTVSDLDFSKMARFHKRCTNHVTVATYKQSYQVDLGVLDVDSDNRITDYREKPVHEHVVSMGAYVFSPSVLKELRRGERVDLPDLILRLQRKGYDVRAFLHSGLWLDMGRPLDFTRLQEDKKLNRKLRSIMKGYR